jgi:malate dehydrogenase
MNKKQKISIIGAGHIGVTTAFLAFQKNLADLVLLDIVEGLPQGMALDILHTSPFTNTEVKICGTNNYEDTRDSDIVVICAGLPRKPGMTREDLLSKNAGIVKKVVEQVKVFSPHALLLVVTNPLDIMARLALQVSGFPKNRVLGMGGMLDGARFSAFISRELSVAPQKIKALVIGSHGETMLPLPSFTRVSGKPLLELLPQEKIDALVKRTRQAGAEVLSHLKSGSAYFAPAASIVSMLEIILADKKEVVACSAYLEGEYGLEDIFIGVPAKLGRKGIEKIVELDLSKEEREALKNSAEAIRSGFRNLPL